MKNTATKLTVLMMVVLLIVSLFPMGALAAGTGFNGSGTEADPYEISSLADLILFRNNVNGGEPYEDKYFVQTADIDLGSENWEPIGSMNAAHGFMGNYDGNGFKIKNLTITNPALDSDGYAYAAFFGLTEGVSPSDQNTVENLIFENVSIKTTGDIAATAIAYAYYTVVNNVKVTGNIKIEGGNYTAGILAYTRRCINASNLSIIGNSGSTISGNVTVGGVISDIQMNGGLTASYSNFSASGLTISGNKNVGGISGIISSQTLDTCSVKDIAIDCADASAGIISGSLGSESTIKNAEHSNVSGAASSIGSAYGSSAAIQAKVGSDYFATLAEAIAAADGKTVTIEADIALTESITIPEGKEITIDLNGKTVSMADASGATAALLKNEGTLTIKDSVGGGKLTFNTTTPSAANAYASNTISNYGTLTVESGTIENTSVGGGACYALDNYAGSTANIKGGKLTAVKTTVRIFNWTDGDAAKATLNITGGEIVSELGYAINVNSGNAPEVAINISGGTIKTNDTTYNLAVYIVNKNSAENLKVNVTGGTFDGNFALNGVTSTTMSEDAVSISGGTFEGVICYDTPAHGFVSGGSFASDVSEFLVDGAVIETNADGTYGVHFHELTHFEAKAPTCAEAGNIEYWYCANGNMYFSDAEGLNEISADDIAIPKTGEHSFADGECSVCGEPAPEEDAPAPEEDAPAPEEDAPAPEEGGEEDAPAADEETEEEDDFPEGIFDKNPTTGENILIICVAGLFLLGSAAAIIILAVRRRASK